MPRYCEPVKPVRLDVGCLFMYVGTLAAPEAGYTLALTGINADGSAIALWAGPATSDPVLARYYPGRARLVEGQISGPPIRYSEKALDAHQRAKQQIDYLQPASGFLKMFDDVELNVHRQFIQSLPDKEILLVSAYYCQDDKSHQKVNAALLDGNGNLIRSGKIGDNIGHVLADSSGQIWVGYDDVYLSDVATGIKVWTNEFASPVEYMSLNATEGTRIGVYDCLSLNVTDDTVWASSYSNVPLVKINENRVDLYRRVAGSNPCGTLVVENTVAVFEGNSLKVFLIDDERGKAELHAICKLSLPVAEPAWRIKPTCRGSIANLFRGPDWYTCDLNDLLPLGTPD